MSINTEDYDSDDDFTNGDHYYLLYDASLTGDYDEFIRHADRCSSEQIKVILDNASTLDIVKYILEKCANEPDLITHTINCYKNALEQDQEALVQFLEKEYGNIMLPEIENEITTIQQLLDGRLAGKPKDKWNHFDKITNSYQVSLLDIYTNAKKRVTDKK
jgi:hypothetical protein